MCQDYFAKHNVTWKHTHITSDTFVSGFQPKQPKDVIFHLSYNINTVEWTKILLTNVPRLFCEAYVTYKATHFTLETIVSMFAADKS